MPHRYLGIEPQKKKKKVDPIVSHKVMIPPKGKEK